ncbi:molybdopterin converting factor subunit 1 [Thermoflexibacter ruber]|uniref:Molybdopterin synthase sulfur carrier subunit n=1 Tax=Thermoflexibacter ruber TaxID=1003 RepID=A0A1I2IIL4_9BACT|nr:molybdopterin converting factor subunit 1 [Thermoflexibacter ruber]SFF41498.1 molybdopterin synthase sulfur carrier subunit [Thermoflexibacter ruber]
MKVEIILFGITKEIIGKDKLTLDLQENSKVIQVMERLYVDYPKLKNLKSLLVAVNSEYAEDEQVLSEKDEIALIPPVSGG